MKNNIYLYIILAFVSFGSWGCYKDKGNYDYHPISELSITQFDVTNGYSVTLGDTLSISPVFERSLPAAGDNYSYEWSFFIQYAAERVLSTDKNLKIKINESPGVYTLQYRVTDKNTGILYHARTTLTVKTDVYEGYMVLNEVDGKSRLDMLSYNSTARVFTQYTDILKIKGSSLPVQDKPYKVLCTRVYNAFSYSDSLYGIYLLTASGTKRVHPESFNWSPTYDIRYEVANPGISQSFKAENLVSDPAQFYVSIYMVSGTDVYVRSASNVLYNLPVNRYAGQTAFKAAPMVVGNEGSRFITMFNMDNKSFAMLPNYNSTEVVDVPKATKAGELDYPRGQNLMYMDKNAANNAYAVTKDPVSSICYLTRFVPGSLPTMVKQIKGVDIDKATHFAVSNNPEYLFYTVGGKLYEYDFASERSILMLDKGNKIISYLAFEKFSAAASVATYSEWAKWLTVGSYDPAGTAGANGVLEQYSVTDANEPLVLKNTWTGFGIITSISYRERK